jgi:hypothetical protein
MSYKLKQDSIQGFSSKICQSVCDQFYASNDKMDGAALMQLTASKQVNAFLIKALFEKWQQETDKLKSPYFDFEHKKVQEALKTFMNVLSAHMSIARADLEPLLEQAVRETVLITFDPVAYVQSVLSQSGNLSTKYIKTRVDSFKKLDSISYVTEDDFESDFPIEPEAFVKLLGGNVGDLFEEESKSFFEQADEVFDAEEDAPELTVVEEKPVNEEVKEAPKSIAEDHEEDSDTVNDKFNGNEKVQTLADKLNQGKKKSLENSLNLNEKFMFVNSLFDGDKQRLSEALADMEEAGDLEGAKMKAYKYSEDWDMESEEVAAFFEVIERRFV